MVKSMAGVFAASLLLAQGAEARTPVHPQHGETRATSRKPAPLSTEATEYLEGTFEASDYINECLEKAEKSQSKCSGNWLGINFTVDRNYEFEIHVPDVGIEEGRDWRGSCHQDRMSDVDWCFVYPIKSSGYSVSHNITKEGGKTFVNWGDENDAFDRPHQVRFDQNTPIDVPKQFMKNSKIGTSLTHYMSNSKHVLFRYYSWPERYPIEISIDLAHFKEFNMLMGGMRLSYALKR
jgi:hypothetical protein